MNFIPTFRAFRSISFRGIDLELPKKQIQIRLFINLIMFLISIVNLMFTVLFFYNSAYNIGLWQLFVTTLCYIGYLTIVKYKKIEMLIIVGLFLQINIILTSSLVNCNTIHLFLIPLAITGFALSLKPVNSWAMLVFSTLGYLFNEFNPLDIQPMIILEPAEVVLTNAFNIVTLFFTLFFIINFFLKSIKLNLEDVYLQKSRADELNIDLIDSINYTKRIQQAMLPNKSELNSILPNNFVFYAPKDIISGDFYWAYESENIRYFAVGDCTGHGIPGSFIAVICQNSLNSAIKDYGLKYPNEILDQTRELIIDKFSSSKEFIYDGMDIAFCCIMNEKLYFAGANRPLWIVRKNKIVILYPDREPVSNYLKVTPFTLHEFALEPDDVIYMFSDGFADQLGGWKGKKLKIVAFKELILKLHRFECDQQKEYLDEYFKKWKGDHDQIDDVCIMGVKAVDLVNFEKCDGEIHAV